MNEYLAKFIVEYAITTKKNLIDEFQINIKNSEENEVLVEIIIYLMLLLDRTYFQEFGEKIRDTTIDFLLLYFRDIFGVEFFLIYNKRISEYSNYGKLLPEDDENPKNTLYWEFGKKIAQLLTGNDNPFIATSLIPISIEYCLSLLRVDNLVKFFGRKII